jgi:hypothetical protein
MAGRYTDTVQRTITHGSLALVLVLGGASVASAQSARDLGVPYPHAPGAAATVVAPPATPPSALTPMTPSSYSDVSVPVPPPVYPAPHTSLMVDSPDLRIGATIAARIRTLDADLQILGMRGSDYFGPILTLLLGGGTLAFAIYADVNQPPGTTSPYPIYLYTSAGGMMARGVLSLVLMSNPSQTAIRYTHMPMRTASEVRERLRFGEEQLDSIADFARIGRILDGSINLATGLAVLPIVFGIGNFDPGQFTGWLLLGLGAVQVVVGIISLASMTEAERRQDAYHELRGRLLGTEAGQEDVEMLEREADARAASEPTITPTASISPAGAFAGAVITF